MASLTEQIARQLIAEHGWQQDLAEDFIRGWGEESPFWAPTWKSVRKLSPATLGIIACSGKGSRIVGQRELGLSEVPNLDWIDKHDSGKHILRVVATTAIICKIYDLLHGQASQVRPFPASGHAFTKLVLYRNADDLLVCSVYMPVWHSGAAYREAIWTGSREEAIEIGYISGMDDVSLSVLPENFWDTF